MVQIMRGQDPPEETAVLLVCIYNQFGNVITHDYLYQLFSPHGSIVKILIFEKAKVWKTFVEYTQPREAEQALAHLNNRVIFEDGSKMNIFRSKLKHVQFQNDNLGGVNYQQLQERQEWTQPPEAIRKRRSTFQDYIPPFYALDPAPRSHCEKDSGHESTSAKYGSESLSAKLSHDNESLSANPHSFGALFDIEEQFRQIALESEEFKAWEETEEVNRRKSKTIVNPHSQQFLLENCPSKVLFVRSLPQSFDHDCVYNIFSNFGRVSKVIFIADKGSALVEFDSRQQAIQAKDEINYVKPAFKVFYSHYESLILKTLAHNEQEQEHEYKSEGPLHKAPNFNPPSEILYCTLLSPAHEEELRELCQALGCPILTAQWRQNAKDKWMCLLEFASLNDSLLAMGKLQNRALSTGRHLRLSFTRSRLRSKNYVSKHVMP